MAKDIKIKSDEVAFAVSRILTEYCDKVVRGVNAATQKAARRLVSITWETAPVKSGKYRRLIDCKELEKKPTGDTWIWYVKEPRYRITHLIVKGHRKANGKGRTRSNSFLPDAIRKVEPEYEADIEKAARGEQI